MSDIFKNHGILTNGILSVTPRESMILLKQGAWIVDLRETDFSDFKTFDVENIINLPLSVFEQHVDLLHKEKYYILADTSGLNSRFFVQKLQSLGYKHVSGMSGGFVEWERDGLPVRINVNERLSGSCACQLKPRERKKN
jgi:rhodanese-related sulfurtransferase